MKLLAKMWASKNISRIGTGLILGLTLATLNACIEEPQPAEGDPTDTQDMALDAAEEFYTDDPESMAQAVLISYLNTDGRLKADDDRLDCATITKNGDETSGAITVDFGTGCTDMRGHIRKGKMVIVYNGAWAVSGSTWTISFDNYSINDIKVTGDRSFTNVTEAGQSNLRFSVFMQAGNLQWPNGDVASRSVVKFREIELGENNTVERLIVTGTIEGVNRLQRNYTIAINEPLVYKRSCALIGVILPVAGEKIISVDQRQITVDYGENDCDNLMTLTNQAGKTWTLTINP